MRITSIDIGTNTILMLIADIGADGSFAVIREEQVIARLGKGVDARRRITPETTERVVHFLGGFWETARSFHPDRIVACGTSALRDAANGVDFVQLVREEIGLEITILSGAEEAELTYLGAVSEFMKPDSKEPFAVLDIGGGSTELTIGNGYSVRSKTSLDLGSVRLTERILQDVSTNPSRNRSGRKRDQICCNIPSESACRHPSGGSRRHCHHTRFRRSRPERI